MLNKTKSSDFVLCRRNLKTDDDIPYDVNTMGI